MSNSERDVRPEEEADAPEEVPTEGMGSTLGALRGPQALERLRERVETAARELERLRRDNTILAERIAELEARPEVDEDQTFLVLDEDAESVRRKIEGFIQAVDAYLAREREEESEQ